MKAEFRVTQKIMILYLNLLHVTCNQVDLCAELIEFVTSVKCWWRKFKNSSFVFCISCV